MTPGQERIALDLLREAIDWIGLVNLTDAEEKKAERVQERIERLLVDLGEMSEAEMCASPEMITKARRYLLIRTELDEAVRERMLLTGETKQHQPRELIDRLTIVHSLVRRLEREKTEALIELSRAMAGRHQCVA